MRLTISWNKYWICLQMTKLIFILIFSCFLIPSREIPDTVKVKQFQVAAIKLDTLNTKLDSIILILQRKNDTLK